MTFRWTKFVPPRYIFEEQTAGYMESMDKEAAY